MNQLIAVSLRQKALYIPADMIQEKVDGFSATTGLLVANLAKIGFGVSAPLLAVLHKTNPAYQAAILDTCGKVVGLGKGWTPLVKGWEVPTGESLEDHIQTFFVNVFGARGNTLPCGHIIPANTFPLHRYNGCPFCSAPFELAQIEHYKQGSKQKVLDLWTEKEMNAFLEDLLTSKTPLDATQLDSLKLLLAERPLPSVKIGMKETLVAVIELLVANGQPEKAQPLFKSPADVLRYLWFKHTGFYQLIEPKTIIKGHTRNNRHWWLGSDTSAKAKIGTKGALKLKYTRKQCIMVAGWLNNLPMDAAKMCENMHPKRGIWVRFIRALRLAEYSQRKGWEKLHEVLDLFYKQEYTVWQARVNHFRLRYEAENTFTLLQQRPGLFARSLFANMLWFGRKAAMEAFAAIRHQVPARLLFTLDMYAADYFDPANDGSVKPLGGTRKNIPAHQLTTLYNETELHAMREAVRALCIQVVENRFAAIENKNTTIYIDPVLFKMPVSIGDRSDTIQDMPGALMGTRFPVSGDKVRLFMQWGTGLPAQHLDMDLSCQVTYESYRQYCNFVELEITGCNHSGDFTRIPHMKGVAEYIEIDIPALKKAGARYVSFTCNAYSNGSITPNLVVGWMNSQYKMRISESTGVAYDPSCVQHQVRVVNSLTKGMLFGVLDVKQREIIWLEMPFAGQVVQNLDAKNVEAFLRKLNNKLSIGVLVQAKAAAQGLQLVDTPQADEVYTRDWALNTAAVTKLLID